MKEKPLSLAPLSFPQAIADLLKVKPDPKKIQANTQAKSQKPTPRVKAKATKRGAKRG